MLSKQQIVNYFSLTACLLTTSCNVINLIDPEREQKGIQAPYDHVTYIIRQNSETKQNEITEIHAHNNRTGYNADLWKTPQIGGVEAKVTLEADGALRTLDSLARLWPNLSEVTVHQTDNGNISVVKAGKESLLINEHDRELKATDFTLFTNDGIGAEVRIICRDCTFGTQPVQIPVLQSTGLLIP